MIDYGSLRRSIGGEMSQSADDIARTSHDASIFEIKPEAVVYPKDAADVKKIVAWVAGQKPQHPELSLTARAAGSDMSGGPLNDSVILDFTKHFDHIVEVGDGFAVAEPGVYYRDFEKATLEKGWLLPSYPASRELCTIGGMVSNNSGGEKSLRYGKTERYIEELNMVLSDGNEYVFRALSRAELESKKSQPGFEGKLYREMYELIDSNYGLIIAAKPDVSKNSAGYYLWNVYDRATDTFDLTRLLTGSQGTLGLVTKIRFRLIRPNKISKLLIIFMDDLAPLGDLVNAVMQFKPESFETYDDQTLKLALKFLPELIKSMKGSALSLFFKFMPEALMVVEGGLPKLVLLAEFTGDDEVAVDANMTSAQEAIKKFNVQAHVTKDAKEVEKYWKIRRESFNLLRHHVRGKHTAPFIDDVIVHVNQLPVFLPKLNELVRQYPGLTYSIAGHAGDANFHVIPLMDFHDEANRAAIPELSEKVYDLIVSLHGSITAEHNDGLIRTPYLEKMYGPEIVKLFKRTKDIFDPLDIFNPRKKVGGTLEYALNHIIKD